MLRRISLDHIGAAASTICAVHCLLTGLALGLLSVAGLGFVASKPAEITFIAIAIVVGIAALLHGHRRHHSMVPAYIFVAAVAVLLVKQLAFSHSHAEDHHAAEVALSVTSGVLLVLFHVVNQRMQHTCGGQHCRHKHD